MIYAAMYGAEMHFARASSAIEARRIFARSFNVLERERRGDDFYRPISVSVSQVRKIAKDYESDTVRAPHLDAAVNTADRFVTFKPYARPPSGKLTTKVESFYKQQEVKADKGMANLARLCSK